MSEKDIRTDVSVLDGAKLIPLANGKTGTFSCRYEDDRELFVKSLTRYYETNAPAKLGNVTAIVNKFYPDRVQELSERLQSTYGKEFVSLPSPTTYYMIEDEYDLFVRCLGDRIVHRDAMSIMPKSLNITRVSKAQMLLSILERLENMDQSVAIDVVKVVLRDFSRLCSQSKTFRDRVAEMKFVPDVSGIFRKPSELYVEIELGFFVFTHTQKTNTGTILVSPLFAIFSRLGFQHHPLTRLFILLR